MGTISYIIIIFNNAGIFTKISISLIILLFLYTTLISIKMYLEIKKEDKTLSDINIILNEDKIFNDKIDILKKNKTKSYKIYESGINEFIYLYKKGITDINIITHLVEEAMKTEMLDEKKNIHMYKIKILKEVLINLSILYIFLSFILYFQQESIILLQNLNILNIILILNELLLPITIIILILVKIKIIENIFANLNLKIYNKQKIFIKYFLLLLHHKFYE